MSYINYILDLLMSKCKAVLDSKKIRELRIKNKEKTKSKK